MQLEDLVFGIEIEMTGVSRAAAIRLLKEALLEHRIVKYVNNNKITTLDNRIWKIVNDTSITPVVSISQITDRNYLTREDIRIVDQLIKSATIELVTPKCTLKDWHIIRTILKKFRNNGARVNESCGIHIHVDATHYDGAFLHKLSYVVMSYEPIIYEILGTHRNRKFRYCLPMNRFFKSYINMEAKGRMGRVTLEALKNIWRSPHMEAHRYHGLNLENVLNPDDKCTVEFRYFNSTLHAGKIRSYLYLVAALLNKAHSIKAISDVRFRSYRNPTEAQLEKWLSFMGLTEDTNVYNHLFNGYTMINYFMYPA